MLCPRRCGVPRGEGFCGAAAEPEVASVCLHRGEEPPLNPIVNIFFAHCNLQCIYCQNRQISLSDEFGVRSDELKNVNEIADRVCQLITTHYPLSTIHSPLIGFVTAAHYAYAVRPIVEAVRARGIEPTVVYNSSGYESVDTLRTLEGVVDVYLPDLKYLDSDIAERYSHAPDYPEVATAAILEMARQVGRGLKLDTDGIAYRGLLVRHLVLPGHTENSLRCLDWLADNLSLSSHLSIMAQYFPPVEGLPAPLDRTVTADEYARVTDHAVALGFSNIWTQELTAQRNYRPDFTCTDNPFETQH